MRSNNKGSVTKNDITIIHFNVWATAFHENTNSFLHSLDLLRLRAHYLRALVAQLLLLLQCIFQQLHVLERL